MDKSTNASPSDGWLPVSYLLLMGGSLVIGLLAELNCHSARTDTSESATTVHSWCGVNR